MASGHAIAIGLGRHSLSAVSGARDGGSVRIERVLNAEPPNTDDARELGAWLATQLERAGFPAGRVTFALPRDQFGIKRLVLPTTDAVELPEMARLAMVRDLPFDASDAVIDFLPLEQTERSTTVLAVAAPQPVLEYARSVAHAAGLGLQRVSMRAMGTACLARTINGQPDRSCLVIDVDGRHIEFSIIVDGVVRFVRGAEFTNGVLGPTADAVVTETRRTWMSYRMSDDAADVDEVLLLGVAPAVNDAAERIGALLGAPARVVSRHPMVNATNQSLDAAWPLAGLLLEPMLGQESIDVANPRRAPDLGARRRRRVLLAAGCAVVLLAAAAMAGTVHLKRLQREVTTLSARQRSAVPHRRQYHRDVYQLEHLQQWASVQVDWMAHLAELVALAPPAERVVLDEFAGALEFRGVTFEDNTWDAPHAIRIALEGEASDRATADAFRAALVEADLYTAASVGADGVGGKRLPFGFTYTLRSQSGRPPAPKPSVRRVDQGATGEDAS